MTDETETPFDAGDAAYNLGRVAFDCDLVGFLALEAALKAAFEAGQESRRSGRESQEVLRLLVACDEAWRSCPKPVRDAHAPWREGDGCFDDAPTEDTVEVRIAVAVGEDGGWGAAGATGLDEDTALVDAFDSMSIIGSRRGAHVVWVTASVPLPSKPSEVEGSVEQ